MATAFENFKFYYAKSLTENKASEAVLFINNSDGVQLRYVRPATFAKRVTDVSNIQSQDKKAPDTGNAINGVEIQFALDRTTAQTNDTVLKKLLQMWFLRGNDTDFRDGRFGLSNNDNPELDAEPVANGGYRLMNYEQLPNSDTPATLIYVIQIQFLGDHTILGAFN